MSDCGVRTSASSPIYNYTGLHDQCYAAYLPLVAGDTDAQFLQAHFVAAGPESVDCTGAQSTVTHDRRAGEATSIIDYYKTNIEYEKKIKFNIPNLNIKILGPCEEDLDLES